MTTTGDDGAGSLREAIELANAALNISDPTGSSSTSPARGPHTIQPLSQLPIITDPVVIDGYTQPGASPNTRAGWQGSDAVLLIELDGSLAGERVFGLLHIQAGDSTVRGLVINRVNWVGIALMDAGNNVIEGNFIGTERCGAIGLF